MKISVLGYIWLFISLILQGCQGLTSSSSVGSGSLALEQKEVQESSLPTPLPDPHNHVIDVNESQLDLEDFKDFQVVPATVAPDLERENETSSQSKTLIAFSVCDEQACKIFFEDIEADQIYEIQGLPLPHRPFSGLVWITDNILVFDRWSQPHYGVHYVVDVNERNLLLASPITDEAP